MNPHFTAYWQILLKSLVHLCSVEPLKARMIVRNLRQRLLASPEHMRRDMIFHMDPWQLALRLSGGVERELTRSEQAWYEKTVQTSTDEAAVVGTEDEVREFQPNY